MPHWGAASANFMRDEMLLHIPVESTYRPAGSRPHIPPKTPALDRSGPTRSERPGSCAQANERKPLACRMLLPACLLHCSACCTHCMCTVRQHHATRKQPVPSGRPHHWLCTNTSEHKRQAPGHNKVPEKHTPHEKAHVTQPSERGPDIQHCCGKQGGTALLCEALCLEPSPQAIATCPMLLSMHPPFKPSA